MLPESQMQYVDLLNINRSDLPQHLRVDMLTTLTVTLHNWQARACLVIQR